jgi:pyruvate formate lyase activating enzyme
MKPDGLSRREFLKRSYAFCLGCSMGSLLNLSAQDTLASIRETRGMKEAMFYQPLGTDRGQCLLCFRNCILNNGERAFCRVREMQEDKLYTLVYGLPCVMRSNQIEINLLYHILPASNVLSIGTAGCNMRCKFCIAWTVSQSRPEETVNFHLPPAEVVKQAQIHNCDFIAYTYSEATVYYEYMFDTARLAQKNRLKNIYVTSGYINPEPLKMIAPYIDAMSIDMKGFDDRFLREFCAGSLEPLLKTTRLVKELGIWLELTYIVLPSLNDNLEHIRKMCFWIRHNLGETTPLHFIRFLPVYKMSTLPLTPVSVLEKAREVAQDAGLKFVYIGGVPGHPGENTYCPHCQKMLIERRGYFLTQYFLANYNLKKGRCRFCRETIPGIWPDTPPPNLS